MNKGMFVHIITTLLYCLIVVYIIGDFNTEIKHRIVISFFFLFSNFIAFSINDYNNFYKTKI